MSMTTPPDRDILPETNQGAAGTLEAATPMTPQEACTKLWGDLSYVITHEALLATTMFSKFDAPPLAFVMHMFAKLRLPNANPKKLKRGGKKKGTAEDEGRVNFRVWGAEKAAFHGYAPPKKKWDNPYILGSAIDGKQQDLASMLVSLGVVDLTELYTGLSWVGLACEAGLPHLVQQLCENCNQGPQMLMTPGDVSRHAIMPLHMACDMGHVRVVKYLAERFTPQATFEDDDAGGANEGGGASSSSVLGSAPTKKPVPKVDWNAQCQNGTPLHYAAFRGHIEVVSVLAQLPGVDVNAKAENGGLTALHVACKHRRVAVVKQLIRRFNANPMALDESGSTPLHYACAGGIESHETVEIIEYFASLPDMDFSIASFGATDGARGVTILHEAASSRNGSAVRALLRCCCEPWAPVPLFGKQGEERTASEFPTPKAYLDPNVLTREAHESALHKAVFQRSIACIDALCECPLVDVKQVVTPTGWSMVHIAASLGNRAVLSAVLTHVRNRTAHSLGITDVGLKAQVQAAVDKEFLSIVTTDKNETPSDVALDFGYKGLADMVAAGKDW